MGVNLNKIIISGLLCISGVMACYSQTASVLSTGNWFKFSVTQDGMVKIDYNQLRSAGVNPDQINPKKIKIYTGSYGMLPQANSANRKNDLTEIAIQISGEEDEKFTSSDYILFFAKGPDSFEFDQEKETFDYENNLYSDKNYYFLTISESNGKRLTTQENLAGTFPVITAYNDFAYYETEKYNLLKSGRHWFGEQFDASLSATIRFDIAGIVENSEIQFISHVMAQSITNTSFEISVNNSPILTQPIDAVPNTPYAIKGRVVADTIRFLAESVSAPANQNQDIKYTFVKGGPGISVGYLDFFIFSFKRKLALYAGQTIFRSRESTLHETTSYTIESASSTTQVWDVSNPDNAVRHNTSLAGSKLSFSTSSNLLRTFVVFNPSSIKNPLFEGKVSNQNLHQLASPDLLIITHPLFLSEAQRLATHRNNHNGLSVHVTTTDLIFNEYSGGKQDITALRDFIRALYTQPSSSLGNVLLFGRGSYDYKNRVLGNTNFVPTFESLNSLSPLETYSSDDYFSFMEEDEGNWFENPAQEHTMDIGVGRLPVKTTEEAKHVVDKLIEYDLKQTSVGPWQNEILFVADDGDFNLHQSQSDQLANSIELYDANFTARKFYLDSFEQLERASGQYSPAATKALNIEMERGALIVNYTGHGSEQVWMDERILDANIISEWKQGPRYPLFVTATCEFGRHDDPFQISSGEKTLIQKKGGAIGLVTTSRPVWSSYNELLNKAFYESLFTKQDGKYRNLGEIFRDTKNQSVSDIYNRNFSLLADPSMKLALPDNQIQIDNITTHSELNQLKGLSKVTVTGSVHTNGTRNESFNGELLLTLYDDFSNRITLGDENPPYNFIERSNIFFRGKTSITQGGFLAEFIMPANTPDNIVTGKFSATATNKLGDYAGGFQFNDAIGELETNSEADNAPPLIKLFLGDTTFIPGGKVGPNTKIVALLSDQSGINTFSINNNNNIQTSLDGMESIILNSYYEAATDTYKKGTVIYPLKDLEKGKHTLSFTASDVHNNVSTTQVEFVVTDGSDIEIEEFTNYPNPFQGSTLLEFTHSRPGEDLEAILTIYDMAGHQIIMHQFEIPSSQYRVTLTEWDGRNSEGGKLSNGLYLGRLSVRSLLDGSKNERITKLIILN